MANPAGESNGGVLKLDFDRRLTVHFRGSVVTPDARLLAYRELDDALGLTAMAGETLPDARTGKNGRHALVGLLRQSVFGRLAGYEDVNDAERLRHDPAMRWIVGGNAAQGRAASPSQMGRFETQWLAAPANLSALADLSGQWIDLVHGRRPPICGKADIPPVSRQRAAQHPPHAIATQITLRFDFPRARVDQKPHAGTPPMFPIAERST
jgi:hypothetical protein